MGVLENVSDHDNSNVLKSGYGERLFETQLKPPRPFLAKAKHALIGA